MPYSLHYPIAAVLLTIYGLRVCPFIGTLSPLLWSAEILAVTALAALLRPLLHKSIIAPKPLPEQPTAQALLDGALFLAMSVALGLINFVLHDFPLGSAGKIASGMALMGFFAAIDEGMRLHNRLLATIPDYATVADGGDTQSLPQRFALLAGVGIMLITGLLLVIVGRDTSWLVTAPLPATDGRLAVMLDVAFILGIIMAHVLNLTRTFAHKLRLLFSNQNNVLQAVAKGDLTVRVPVATRDEFGTMAHFTNHMIASLRASNETLTRTQHATIVALASLAEARDDETGNHIVRTQEYVHILASHLAQSDSYHELTPDMIDMLRRTAPLHDIGKVGIPDAILLKPGKLTPEEFTIMQHHPSIGAATLRRAAATLGNSSFLDLAATIAHTHHERWDGSGYPNGLSGTEIPLAGRLMAVADVYDALISQRVYKPAFSHEKACQILAEGSGTHFDPAVVQAFMSCSTNFETVAQKYADAH